MPAVLLHPFAPRPLEPTLSVPATAANGPIEPIARVPLVRHRERTQFGPRGAVVAGGGWPAPLLRGWSFGVLPHVPVVQPVNVVTGVPTTPGTPSRKRRSWQSKG